MSEQPLTGLERELIAYVEQLATASMQSAQVLRDLEQRSTGQMTSKLDLLTAAVNSLGASQIELASCLNDLVTKSAASSTITNRLRAVSSKLSGK